MAEQRHLLAREEHVGEVLQRVDGDAALMHEAVRDRLAGDAGEFFEQRVGVGDAVGRRDLGDRHVEGVPQVLGGRVALVAGERDRGERVRRVLEVLDRGAAMRVDRLVGKHRRVEVFGVHEEGRLDAHLLHVMLQKHQVARIDPAGEEVELAGRLRLFLRDALHDGEHAFGIAADLARFEARRVHRHDVDFAAREDLLELLLRAHDRAFAVVADHLCRAGGDHAG